MRPSPKYWWDFRGHSVVIESDWDEFPILAQWSYILDNEAYTLIKHAEEVIADLRAGRVDPRKMYKQFLKGGV